MNSQINNDASLYECCVCYSEDIPTSWFNKCRTCVGGLCHNCYNEMEYSKAYSVVDCPMCRNPMITNFINIRFIDIIQDWNMCGDEIHLPVVKLLFKNANPDSKDLCHTCNNWEKDCVCAGAKKVIKRVVKRRMLCDNCGKNPPTTNQKCGTAFADWCEECDNSLYSTKDDV